ncbi:MAG: acetate--CoA ligase [Candidatus Pacearchaeota archaeon]
MSVEKKFVIKKGNVFWPSKAMKKQAHVTDAKIYEKADKNPLAFWAELAKKGITWQKPWKKIYEEKLPFFKWFSGAKLNACYNCLDRHLQKNGHKTALIWVPEPIEEKAKKISYQELYEKVCRMANLLLKLGIKKGDVVAIYLPMIPEVIISMLACARIGAIHTVVFSAFSAEALKTRLKDSGAKILITADGYYRRGKLIELKKQADKAIEGTKVGKVLVVRRAGNSIELTKKDIILEDEIEKVSSKCDAIALDSEHPLFILYTSGTTGKPKGVVHATGGYVVQAYWTAKWNFDLHEQDIMWCTADIGWITGHTYGCYGPLLNGITTLIYEGSFDFPTPSRAWQIIEEHKVNVFYTAPTLLRMFAAFGKKWLKNFELSTLKILGTVGEPIDESTWLWFFKEVGKGRCPIIDTWWQTETGGTLINALPGIGPFIPSVAGRSFPGTRHAVVDEKGNKLKEKQGFLVQLSPFAPGMLRGIWKNKKMYKEKYWSQYKNMYFTGDGAIERDGLFKLIGRIDDVIKVAGHRLATAELENALDKHKAVRESAVTGKEDPIKGEVPVAFVVLEKSISQSKSLEEELIKQVEKEIGPIARPSKIYFVEDLPKTRSGKIIRRILKALLKKQPLGDTSTLVNPECIEKIKEALEQEA